MNGLRRAMSPPAWRTGRIGRRMILATVSMALVALAANPMRASIVRFQFSIPGVGVRTIDVRLYDAVMPRTTANFLDYVDDNDWDGSVIHRRSATADSGVNVVQGGGFIIPAAGLLKTVSGQTQWNFQQVPTEAPIADEPGGGVVGPSNLAGTIAMAKSGPNTATSQWFFNSTNNTQLDAIDQATGGFAAFGRILLSGMNVLNEIIALPRYNVASPFNTLPVQSIATINTQQNVFPKDVVIVQDIRRLSIIDGDYNRDNVVNNADLALWRADFGSQVKAEADGNGNGIVDAPDFLLWQRNYGRTAAASAVPEPGAAMLALLAVAGLMRRSLESRR